MYSLCSLLTITDSVTEVPLNLRVKSRHFTRIVPARLRHARAAGMRSKAAQSRVCNKGVATLLAKRKPAFEVR